MEESEYSKPEYIGTIKCGKGRKEEMRVYAVYEYISPETQKEIDIQILRILGFL